MHFDPPLGPLLDRLHAQSDAQGEAIGADVDGPVDFVLMDIWTPLARPNDPANGLRTLTLPFEGGLELTVRA